MATKLLHSFFAKSLCVLVEKESNFSNPDRSLWHFDQMYAGDLQLRVIRRGDVVGGGSGGGGGARLPGNCFDLPKALPGHLKLLSAEVFEPGKVNLLMAAQANTQGSRGARRTDLPPVRLQISLKSQVSFVFPEYRIVLSIALAESLFVVSPTSGRIAFDLVPVYIRTLLEQLVAPMCLDGHIRFEPIIHLSVVATTPTRSFICFAHGRLVNKETHQAVAENITAQLYALVQHDSFRKVCVCVLACVCVCERMPACLHACASVCDLR
jgi:hypothetical protein